MRLFITLLLGFLPSFIYGNTKMYEKTPVDQIRVIELPSRIALEAEYPGSYFDEGNGLFRKLFRYISTYDISMTTPVEGDVEPAKMRFFVGAEDLKKRFFSTSEVKVRKLRPLLVAAIGIRGGYSQERFSANKSKLDQWLANNTEYLAVGNPYGVYWNGPFVPGPFKRSEVHLPIEFKKSISSPSELDKP